MTVPDLIEQVLPRLALPPTIGETEVEYIIAAQIESALEELTRKAAAENSETYLFTKTFSVDAADGVAELSSLLTDAEPLLPDALDQVTVYIDGYDYGLRQAADRAGLRLDPSRVPGYAFEDDSIFIKGRDGKLGKYAGPVRLSNAPYVPSLNNVPRSLWGKLVEIVVRLVSKDPKMKRLASERQAVQSPA